MNSSITKKLKKNCFKIKQIDNESLNKNHNRDYQSNLTFFKTIIPNVEKKIDNLVKHKGKLATNIDRHYALYIIVDRFLEKYIQKCEDLSLLD